METARLFTTVDGRLVRADGFPPHPGRFDRAGLDLERLAPRGPGSGAG